MTSRNTLDDTQERSLSALVLDECECAGRRGRVPRDASLSSFAVAGAGG
jgi:hypothetical protein